MLKALAATIVLSAALVVSPHTDAASVIPINVSCGDSIISPGSYRMMDTVPCTGDALTITASDVTLDMNDHVMSGDDAVGDQGDVGITISGLASNVTVKNGTISGFDDGIDISGSQNTVEDVLFTDNENRSVLVTGDHDNIKGSIFASTAPTEFLGGTDGSVATSRFFKAAVTIVAADNGEVAQNQFFNGGITLSANGGDGATSNTIFGNGVTGAGVSGIVVTGDTSDGNQILNNIVTGSVQDGIIATQADGTAISGNNVFGNGNFGIELTTNATASQITNNLINGSLGYGVNIDATSTGAAVSGNRAESNGECGMRGAAGSAPTFNGNAVFNNGFKNGIADDSDPGICAVDGMGSGNTANGNDVSSASTQCTNSLCTVDGTPTDQPPSLTMCGATGAVDLYNPLDCTGSALAPGTGNLTLTLRTNFIRGTIFGLNIDLVGDIAVTGGVFVGGLSGLNIGLSSGDTVTDTVATHATNVGIALGGVVMHDLTFTDVASTGNTNAGINGTRVDSARFVRTISSGNGKEGIVLSSTGSDTPNDNVIEDGEFSGNGKSGVSLTDAQDNTVQGSVVMGNGGTGGGNGIALLNDNTIADGMKITKNTVRGNVDVGVGVSSKNTSVSKNTVSEQRNGSGIAIAGSDATGDKITSNSTLGNSGGGITFAGAASHNSLKKNKANGNGTAGILLSDPANAKLISNTATSNGFVELTDHIGLGIQAPDGTKGCGNKAKANDDPAQLTPKSLKKMC